MRSLCNTNQRYNSRHHGTFSNFSSFSCKTRSLRLLGPNSIPARLFPYGVTVGSLAIAFIIIELILINQQRLLPGIMMLLSFILLVLFIAGIIATGIQLFGGSNVNNLCQTYVNDMKVSGPSRDTLAWLQQNSICEFTNVVRFRSRSGANLENRSVLECRLCVLDYRHCFPGMDDRYGESSEPERVRMRGDFLVDSGALLPW
jgi:hypothetical protein